MKHFIIPTFVAAVMLLGVRLFKKVSFELGAKLVPTIPAV